MRLGVIFCMIFCLLACDNKEEITDSAITVTNEPVISETETQILNWFDKQQLSNGLLPSIEDGTLISLYDNALAALVFLVQEDYERAERIFDFFNSRINSELKNGVGGFSQFRDRNGVPNNHRWMGDNAWLLIALNNYKSKTGNTKYDDLALGISNWLQSLQTDDGGLYAGYDSEGNVLNFKVTEGMIDAFNAVEGYTTFHSKLLNFLELDRWDNEEKILVSWVDHPIYLHALDLYSLSFLIFEEFPVSSLTLADRFVTTQISTLTRQEVTGYCFDIEKDTVWFEGTGQMTLAFDFANMVESRDFYLSEMEKNLIKSFNYSNAAGFPYASNIGTHYGGDLLWDTADDKIAISSGAWYIFTLRKFNPFGVERNKAIPREDMFWTN